MGVFLLNISVDVADPKPEYIPEDLTINDQESLVEIFIEKVLGYDDFFKEYDDNDTEKQNKKANLKIEFIAQRVVDSPIKQTTIKTTKANFPDYDAYLTNGFLNLDIPPPKVWFA